MGSEWASLTIGDLVREGEASVQTGPFGSQLHSHDYVDSGTAVIPTEAIGRGRILDIKVPRVDAAKASELSRHRLRLGDILFARRGAQATGLSAIVDERFEGALCGTGALLLRVQSTRVDPRYLSMFLSSEAAYVWLRTHAVGAVMPNLNTAIIQALPISLPRIHEQQRIAGFIGALDNRITLLRETNATLEAIAQALFKSWFVDFDPVRAKMEGRTPEGMDEATAALFPDGLETSELGEVPRGWRVAKVGEVAEVVKGKSYSSKDLVDSHHTALVTLKSFERGGGFRMDGFKPYSGAYKPSQVVSAGDLIVAYTDVTQAAELIGKPAVVVGVDEYTTLVASLDVGIVRPDERHCGKQFLYGLFRTDAFQSHTLAHTSGTTVLHLAKDGIGSFAFALPPNELIRSFEVIAAAIASRKQTNSDAVRTLSTLRDTLLPRLISGQLRLPEAQAATEAALGGTLSV